MFPVVTSIDRATPVGHYTSATSVDYTVAFSQTVTGVDATDFKVITDGGLHAQTPVAVSGSGSSYTVQVNGLSGSGDLQLDLVDDDSIENGSSSPLGGTGVDNGSFLGQTYTVDQTDPVVVSIARTTPSGSTTDASAVSYTVTFSEAVTGVDPTDFTLATTGTIATTLRQVTPVSTSVYTVTVSGITGNGTLGLNLVDNGSIHDLAGNPLASTSGAASFANPVTIAAGTGPDGAVVADLNGDGKPDLVALDYKLSSTVSVLLGNGNGTFGAASTYSSGTDPKSLAVGDLNGDGKLDVVEVNLIGNSVSVFLGNGNGTFQSPTTYATGIGTGVCHPCRRQWRRQARHRRRQPFGQR